MRGVLVFLLALVSGFYLGAQSIDEQHSIIGEAEQAYNIGRLELSQSLLSKHLNSFRGSLRQSAFRIMALSSLGMDKEQEAEQYTTLLLRENPYFSPAIGDPQRFVDLVERIKGGMGATITTASSQEENLNESPVPVTLITEQMIKDSGARNLKELLIAYVPGMTNVDCNQDMNIAMRSMYSSGQEKILFMLNGHRLNSYSTNIASPDYSVSLEKVRQIEVLRGPASSLYGGVALTAVVNIITKQGADVDGMMLKAGAGSFGQRRANILFGKRYFDMDVLAWGSIYRADGQKFHVDASETGIGLTSGDVTIGGVGKRPTYDAGVTIKWNEWAFMYDTHFSQLVTPYTMSYAFSPYSYGKYTTYRGLHPGNVTYSHHAQLQYQRNVGNVFLAAEFSFDDSDLTHYDVVSDDPVEHLSRIIGSPAAMDAVASQYPGMYRYHDGQEKAYSGRLKGDWAYASGENYKGLLSFGAEYGSFDLLDSRYLLGVNYSTIFMESVEVPAIAKGTETFANSYLQLKHTWKNVIFNAGLRFDYKKRYNGDKIHEFSPRLAVIYLRPKWNAKFSYSRAFVDAPYFYRKTNLVIAQSGENLKQEIIHSFQATLQLASIVPGLTFEMNGFFNRAENLIYPNGWSHQNAGEFKSIGIEVMAQYKNKNFTGYLAFESAKTLKSTYFGRRIDKMYNVPDYSLSTVLAYQVGKALRLHTRIGATGRQTSYTVDTERQAVNEVPVDAVSVVDTGADYTLGPVTFSANVHNLFDRRYRQGGLNTYLVQQQGRWLSFDIAVKF